MMIKQDMGCIYIFTQYISSDRLCCFPSGEYKSRSPFANQIRKYIKRITK